MGVRVGPGVKVDQRHRVRLGVRVMVGVRLMVGVLVGEPGKLVALGATGAAGVLVAESEDEMETAEACERVVGSAALGVLLGSQVGCGVIPPRGARSVGEDENGRASRGSAQPVRPRSSPIQVTLNNQPDKDCGRIWMNFIYPIVAQIGVRRPGLCETLQQCKGSVRGSRSQPPLPASISARF